MFRVDSELINLIYKLKKMVVGLLGTLIINADITPIPLIIYVSGSFRKYVVFMMTVILKIFYVTEKEYQQSQSLTNVKGTNSIFYL